MADLIPVLDAAAQTIITIMLWRVALEAAKLSYIPSEARWAIGYTVACALSGITAIGLWLRVAGVV